VQGVSEPEPEPETVYKVTDSDGMTKAGTSHMIQWGPEIEHKAPGAGPWGADAWLYCFRDSLLASLHAPLVVGYEAYADGDWLLWRADADLGIWWPVYLVPEYRGDPPESFPWTESLFQSNRYMVGATRLKTIATVTKPDLTTQKKIDLLYALGSKLGNLDYGEMGRSGFCHMGTMIDSGGLTATDAWLDKVIHESLLPWSVYVAYYTHYTTFSLPDEVHTVMD